MAQQIETRVTAWTECKDGPWHPDMTSGGVVSYRIWQQFDGMRWFQRHEWMHADGTSHEEEWIRGVSGFLPGSQPVALAQAA